MKKIFVILFLFVAVTAHAAELTSEQKLEAENFKLRVQVVQLQAQLAKVQNELLDRESRLASVSLSAEQAQLAEKFVKALGGDPEKDAFDWETKTLKAKDSK